MYKNLKKLTDQELISEINYTITILPTLKL